MKRKFILTLSPDSFLVMATTFHFRAVASDGKIRTGTLTAETDKSVAQELRRQGLIPVYVGLEQKKGLELVLPSFQRGRRKDVLFFTQELSTLLNAGVPLDRALSITAELTEQRAFPLPGARYSARAQGRQIAGRQSGDASRRIFPSSTSTWCAPAKPRARCRRFSNAWPNSSAPATICAATSSAP